MEQLSISGSCPAELKSLKVIQVSIECSVAIVKFANAKSKVNSFSFEFLREIQQALSYLEQNAHNFVGLVLMSNKVDNFFAGADVKAVANCERKTALHASRSGQNVIRRLMALPWPTVSAVKGSCLGGGLELVLGTQYVLAVNEPKTFFGAPEVMIGLVPGAGGCNNLPRRINLNEALSMIITGKKVAARKAKDLGLVDMLLEPSADGPQATLTVLEKQAIECVQMLGNGTLQPGGLSLYNQLLLKSMSIKFIRDFLLNKYRSEIMSKSFGHYPAPFAAIDCVETSLAQGLEDGLQFEQLAFADCSQTPEAKSLLRLFQGQTECKKNKFDKAGNFTAIEVIRIVQDNDQGSALGTLTATVPHDVNELETMDVPRARTLVIEAVEDDLDTKKSALRKIEERFSGADYVIATTSMYIPLEELTSNLDRPERVVGLRYFSPVDKSPAVELVRSNVVPHEIAAAVVDRVLSQGKFVVTVSDKVGFFSSRVFAMTAFEGLLLLTEGVEPSELENKSKQMGFTFGILSMMDFIGLDTLVRIFERFQEEFGASIQNYDVKVLRDLVEANCSGKLSGSGWFNYENGKKTTLNTVAVDLLAAHRSLRSSDEALNSSWQPDVKQFQHSRTLDVPEERLLLTFVNEAMRCFRDHVIKDPLEADVVSVLGLGFPPFLGGPFHYCASVGPQNIIKRLDDLKSLLGDRFEACTTLRERNPLNVAYNEASKANANKL